MANIIDKRIKKDKFISYWDLCDKNKTFVDNLHDYLNLRKYRDGKDYIEVDLGEYIAFCPFNYYILADFLPGILRHCVTISLYQWNAYFRTHFYKYGNLKTFFFKKSSKPYKYPFEDKYWEFTCWLDVTTSYTYKHKCDGKKFALLHDCNNYTIEETYNYANTIIENNYDKIITKYINTNVYKTLEPEITKN